MRAICEASHSLLSYVYRSKPPHPLARTARTRSLTVCEKKLQALPVCPNLLFLCVCGCAVSHLNKMRKALTIYVHTALCTE